MRLSLGIAALAATIAVASPAFAQTTTVTAQATARGTVLLPLTLSNTQALDFGTVIASAALGTVTINADTGARTVGGGVAGVATYPGSRALFQGAGTNNQPVLLSYTSAVVLSNGAATLSGTLVLDNGDSLARTIDATGSFAVGVGGTFNIAANQPNGLYSTTFDLTAEYQ